MRATIKSEKGYALLVVLFLIVFIFTVSAVFIRGSLSNAKQEQRVDQNHLAVVAAEMGVDYYIGKVNNEERKILYEVLNNIHVDLVKLNDCGGIPNSKVQGCQSIKSIETILREARGEYIEKVDNLVGNIKQSEPTKVILYSADNKNIESSPYSYEVDKDEVSRVEKDGKLDIKIGVIGNSKAERSKLLKTNLSFEIPKFVIRKTSGQKETVFNPGNIYDFFNKNNEYEKKAGCSAQNGQCLSGKFYSEGSKSANNPNNQGGLIWVHNGYLNAGNMNQFNFTFITKSLEGKNMNQMKGKLLLLGEENKKGEIPQRISIKFQSSGKLCVNVDGFSKSDIERITFDKPGQVQFFSSLINPVWPSNANESPKKSGSLVDFVNDCLEQPLIEIETPGIVQYEVFNSALDLLVDVKY